MLTNNVLHYSFIVLLLEMKKSKVEELDMSYERSFLILFSTCKNQNHTA